MLESIGGNVMNDKYLNTTLSKYRDHSDVKISTN